SKISLENAEKYFKLNNMERDIILRHMWPLTLMPPRFKESIIVSLVDKYISSREIVSYVYKKVSSKLTYKKIEKKQRS
ncbi:MAG: hypothetical protein KAJ22_05705, partial [Candidatus Izimaplasma sp.]|nr:hypothetical protein [Candidatus Izimaplasma bacterium]